LRNFIKLYLFYFYLNTVGIPVYAEDIKFRVFSIIRNCYSIVSFQNGAHYKVYSVKIHLLLPKIKISVLKFSACYFTCRAFISF